jgi:hypothetical protein
MAALRIYKTDAFLDAYLFGTVPSGLSPDGAISMAGPHTKSRGSTVSSTPPWSSPATPSSLAKLEG